MKKLNWQPEIDLNKGLIETIKFLENEPYKAKNIFF